MTSRIHSSAGILRLSLIALCVLSLALPGHALEVWTGASSTDWDTDGNWLDNSKPVATDDVLITNAANPVVLDISTPALTSLTISNNTLTCANWSTTIDAVNVTIRNNGKITVASDFLESAMSNRVHGMALT